MITEANETQEASRDPEATDEIPVPPPLPWEDRPHPWVRFFAKSLDMVTLDAVIEVIFNIAAPGKSLAFRIGVAVGTVVLFPVYDAFLLSQAGNSLGRWLFGVRVRKEGKPLSFDLALRRSFLVLLRGMWLQIPVASLIAMALAYDKLVSTGKSSWDAELGTEVIHNRLEAWKVVLAVMLIFVLASL